jgi:6,7-dimethyl-8-ribityllumazine synthase
MGVKGLFDGIEHSAKGLSFGIAVSRFNETFTKKLADGATSAFLKQGGDPAKIKTIWVPGAFELPLTAQILAKSGAFDAVICLGAVIRGDTPHFDYVCQQTAQGILQVGLKEELPVIFGVITTDNVEQAEARTGGEHGNKGEEAVLAALEMCHVIKHLRTL